MKCILPWINFGTSTYGRPRVCGYSDHDAQWEVLFTDRGYPYPHLLLNKLLNIF